MVTLLITDPIFRGHQTPDGHPERAARLQAIEQALSGDDFKDLKRTHAAPASREQIEAAHKAAYVAQIFELAEARQNLMLDADTWFGDGSFDAAIHAAGAACSAADAVVAGEVKNAFCAVRPPGHHAEHDKAMGFCLFNNAAVAARHLQHRHGLKRIAIVDFDVHHGNGTQDIFEQDTNVFYASSHQSPCYPGTGHAEETGAGNILNIELPPGSGSIAFKHAYQACIFPALEAFRPDFLILSAGFDAHWRDPLAQIELDTQDFAWVTAGLLDIAARHCDGRVISLLEGGYDLQGLAESVAAHVKVLME